jgi:ABC-type glycerol-3-phosphate transport system substrate-binding protein
MNFTKTFLIGLLVTTLTFSACRTKGEEDLTNKPVELTYYKMFDDSNVIDPIIKSFTAKRPNVKINYRQFTDFDDYMTTILNELAEGEGPDIFSMQNTWFASNLKKVVPMPESLGNASQFEEIFVEVAAEDLVHENEDGKREIYAMPMTVDTLALYYNKAHFEDRIPERGRPAATWEGIKNDVSRLNKTDNSVSRFETSGIALGLSENISRAVDILYLLFLQYDVDFYDTRGDSFIADFANNEAAEAVNFFLSFANEQNKHYSWNKFVTSDDSLEEVSAFARGDTSMFISYSYAYDQVLNQIGVLENKGVDTIEVEDIRVAPIPQVFDPDLSGEKRVAYASYFAEAVSRNSEHPDVAWDFILELTQAQHLEDYFEATNKPTSRRDMIADQSEDLIFGVFASQIGYSESFPVLDYASYKNWFDSLINKAAASGFRVSTSDLQEVENLINEI